MAQYSRRACTAVECTSKEREGREGGWGVGEETGRVRRARSRLAAGLVLMVVAQQ